MSLPCWKFFVNFEFLKLAFETLEYHFNYSRHNFISQPPSSEPAFHFNGTVLFLGLSCPQASVHAFPSSWYIYLLPSFSCHNPYLVSLECPMLMNSFLYDLVICHFSSPSSTEHQQNKECCSLCPIFNTTLDNMWLGIYQATIKKRLLKHASLSSICGVAVNSVMQHFI